MAAYGLAVLMVRSACLSPLSYGFPLGFQCNFCCPSGSRANYLLLGYLVAWNILSKLLACSW